MNTSELSTDWLMLLIVAASTVVMYFLARRLMRGMNQQDWILLRQARSRGIDIATPQPVAFVLFTNSREVASELEETLRQDAYETGVKEAAIQYARNKRKPGEAQGGWLITATQVIRLAPEELAQKRKALNELANAPRAVYLGWQVAGATPLAPAPAAQK